METSLDLLKPGRKGIVTAVCVDRSLRDRLRSFGLVPGTVVRCSYRNPWGDVTALNFRGSTLALRTKDLRKIRVRCV